MSEPVVVTGQMMATGGAVVDLALRLIELDAAFARLVGGTRESLLGQSIRDLLPALEAPLCAVLTSGHALPYVPLQRPEDTPLPLRLVPLRTTRSTIVGVELIIDPAGPEAQPPTVRQVLDSLFAFAGVLRPDGTLVEANRAALEAAGLTAADVLGKPFADTFWWAYDPTVQAQVRAAIARAAKGETVRYDVAVRLAEHRLITIDFMLAPVRNAANEVTYLIPSGTDISKRIAAERMLREHEHHLSLALEAAQMGTWEVDLQSRVVLRSSTTDCAFGLTPDNTPRIADDYLQRIHPDDRARVVEAIRRTVEEGAEHVVEYRVIRPDGALRWLASRGELIYDDQGAPRRLIGALLDITERKATEAALAASEARYRVTFEHAPLGIAHLSLDGHWLHVNRRLCAITGYTQDELCARTFQSMIHPDDLAADLTLVEQLLAGSIDGYDLEQRYLHKNGGVVWVNFSVSLVRQPNGAPDYFIAIVEEISRRKMAEAERHFQAQLLDAVGQGIIATNVDGTVRYWNRFAEQLYGWKREEALGRPILDLIAADISLQQGQAIMAQLQMGQPWAGQYFVRRRDGSIFPVFVTDTPIHAPDGAIIGFVGVSADISEPLRLEAEREELLLREHVARTEADEAVALLDTLLTTAPIGLCFLSPDYRYLRINEALAALNGIPAADHLGRTVQEVLPNLASMVEPIFAQVLATGRPLVDQEIIEECPAGRRIWRASYYPIRLPNGVIAGLGIVANDITAGRAAAEALRLSEERFRVALQNSPILVYTTDRALRYTWIYNQHPAYDPAIVLGLRDEELLPSDEAAKLTAVKQRVLERAIGERVELTLDVEGEALTYDFTAEPLRDGAGTVIGLTVAAIDITARRRVEAALRESEARYSTLAEAVPAILFTNRPDGTNDYLSQNYYDYTGTPRGSGVGYAWADQLHPDDRERTVAGWQEAVRTGTPLLIECRFRHHDGAYRWFRVKSRPLRNAAGIITRWFGVCLDIDDAKRAAAEREELLGREQAARAAAERTAARINQLQAVTAALTEALTPVQVADIIVAQSLAALDAESSSLRLISADGRTLDALRNSGLSAETAERWASIPLDTPMPICEVVRTGRPLYFEDRNALAMSYPALEPIVAPLGYQAFAIVPLSIEGRTIGSLALTFGEPRRFADEDRDVLLAMAGLAAQAITRAQLYDTARQAVEVRDTFISIASHDLRSPLTALMGQADLLERQVGSVEWGDQARQRARRIVEQGQRLNRMIGALLDLSRIQSGQFTINTVPLDLTALAARVVAEFRPTLSQHTLELVGVPEELWVAGDEVRLEQVLYNLIGNAVKYSPGGGLVTVRVARQDTRACLAIIDQGIGIPTSAIPRLFERYYRAANARVSGMGIGLYTVHEIVTLHGGTVTVVSEEGHGSTFTVFLPLIAEGRP
jgi:PAS domain S-box-containing protein